MVKYKTILIDPPWPEHGAGRWKCSAERHYKLMSVWEIRRLLIEELIDKHKIGNPCHCYLWVTNNYLPGGIKVLESIGFRYITNLVWVKGKHFGIGRYFRGQHELCLFGVIGKQMTLERSLRTVINEKVRGHSRKPRKMYELIEKASLPPRLEMFAREKREGWDAWGLEVPNTLQKLLEGKANG